MLFNYKFFRSTIMALGSFLDTFQKIADAATNTKGNIFYLSPFYTVLVLSVFDDYFLTPSLRQKKFLFIGSLIIIDGKFRRSTKIPSKEGSYPPPSQKRKEKLVFN